MKLTTNLSSVYSASKKKWLCLYLLGLFLFSFTIVSKAQQKTITATLVDSKTNEPIVFANIGFEGASIGTISDDAGKFTLTFNLNKVRNIPLTISMLGYKTVIIPFQELNELKSVTKKIYMSINEEQLESVVIQSGKRIYEKLGFHTISSFEEIAYWNASQALGGELACLINVRKKNTRLHDFKFDILNQTADSILIRFNVYDFHKGGPGKNLLTKNIYHTITKKKGNGYYSAKGTQHYCG